ncbi:disease resistance protein RPS2-like [Typha angustifolia]|uniref:disease resistance protein RPS2-like n=1 Tax=Typha angustifolia TaxID=59011 RepID=UPI003C2FE81C
MVSVDFGGIFNFLKDQVGGILSSSIGYIMSIDKNIESLEYEMGELKSIRDGIRGKCDTVKLQDVKLEPKVVWWLESVDALEAEEKSTVAEFDRRVKCMGEFSLDLWSSYNISKRSKKLLDRAADLKTKAVFDNVANEAGPPRFIEMPIPSTVGMDSVYEKLEEFVKADDGSIVGIYGMGGVGKTTLLKRFNNRFFIGKTDEVDVVIFVELPSGDFNTEEIQKAMYTRLRLPWRVEETQKERAAAILRALSQIKFILLLDNLWNRLDLEIVGIPVPKSRSKCKIILTSRIEDVCSQMDARKKIKMECLPWNDSWDLFKEKSDEELFSGNPQIKNQAMALARMCGGLPLALTTIARCMRSKRALGEWKHAVNNITDNPSDFPGMEEDVLVPLKQSYDQLPNDALKACLLYFTLWRNNKICECCVTSYWMSEGLINDFEDRKDARNKQSYILGTLRAASLLETAPDESFVGLHPMVGAMALWVARECGKLPNKWSVRYSNDLEKWRRAERISLRYQRLTTLPESPECPNLASLMLTNTHTLTKIPDSFFQSMPCLGVLDLSYTSIKGLPPGIGNLVGLHLLELQSTKITCLPEELKSLVKLKYLGLNWTRDLKAIPQGVIGALRQLLVLESYCSFCHWNTESTLGACFTELESLKKLTRLTLTVGSSAILQWLSESYPMADAVKELSIQNCDGLATMHLSSPTLLKNINCLSQLHLFDFDLKELVLGCGSEEDSEALPSPRFLILENLHRTKIVWRNRGLENLRKLYVMKCDKMEVLLHYEDDSTTHHEEGSRPVVTAFPNLEFLKVESLPKLKSLSDGWILSFPTLKTIVVYQCPELNKLTLVTEKLREFKCNKSWWDQLEWEVKRNENTFQLIYI